MASGWMVGTIAQGAFAQLEARGVSLPCLKYPWGILCFCLA
jgi:hypothetical protein